MGLLERIQARRVRLVEATADQVVSTGGGYAYGAVDPIDGDVGFRRTGSAGREVPRWTREKARTYSVTAYRANPMATAIIDTYTAFCVGDSGVKWQATNPQVAEIVREFWDDPANLVGERQELFLRSQLLMGEKLLELMTGGLSGVVRFAPVDPECIEDIVCRYGNPLWPSQVVLPPLESGGEERRWDVVQVDDMTGLRSGNCMFWAPWRTLDTDVRGMPFLTSVLDDLDSYGTVLSNLIDRTALARYMVWDVEVQGGQDKVDEFVAARGGLHVPPSGSVEVHNDAVKWTPQTVSTGAMEDTIANKSVLTNIASGTGLARTWLADPEDANRATSLTMAEPVRRRVGSVQKVWLAQVQELVRYVIDRAVAAKRLPPMVDAKDPRTGETTQIPASQAVIVTGPEIAASDSQLTAQVLLNLSTGLEKMVQTGALSPEAASIAARKAWEDYVGVPYTADLDSPAADGADIADVVESARRTRERHRAEDRHYVRDEDGKFAHTPGSGAGSRLAGIEPLTPAATPRPPAPAADPLKLAGRIDLAPGESFGGSARVVDGNGDHTIVMARVDGPAGPRIRLGVVGPEDARRWRAADRGRTVELDEAGVAQLRQVLSGVAAQGKQSVSDLRGELRAANAAGLDRQDWPDPEADIAAGVVQAGWGQLHWHLLRTEGDEYEAGGVNYGPGGEWTFGLDPAPTSGTQGLRDAWYIESAAGVRKLDKALANLMGAPATAREAAGGEQLKEYWTKGEGLAKWATSPHPWTALRDHLAKYMSRERANRTASEWFHAVTGHWPAERKGDNPVGMG